MKIHKKYTSYLGYLLTTLFFLQSFSVFCQRNPLNSVLKDEDDYQFIDEYYDIDENTTALSLGTRSGKPLEVGDEIFEHTQIKALVLNNASENSLKKIKKIERLEYLKIYLSNSFKDIPVEIFDLVHLKTLIIRANNVETIPPEIGKLKNLEQFTFITKVSLSVPPEIGSLKKLKNLYLEISHRYQPTLSPLPYQITQLKQLEELTIKYSPVNVLPEGLEELTNLKSLSIPIDTILPPNIGKLKNLEFLNLSVRERHNFNVQALKQLTNLKSLRVLGYGNSDLISVMKDLKQLKYLYLNQHYYQHTDGAKWIGELEQLEELELALPRKKGLDFSKLKHLKYLSIEGVTDSTKLKGLEQLAQLEALKITPSSHRESFLNNIPKEVTYLTNLRYLHYEFKTESGAADFPYEIAQLPKLEYLNRLLPYKSHLDLPTISNLSKELPEIKIIDGVKLKAESYDQLRLDLKKIKHIRKLVIMSSNVTELPPEIGDIVNLEQLSIIMPVNILPDEIKRLKNLKQLSVSHKSFRGLGQFEEAESFTIPSILGQLKELERLSLHELNIEEIPHQIGKLKNLKYINLSNNKITEIPATIKDLKNLEVLKLGYNLIEKLPKQIGELTTLKKIYIGRNKLKEIPKSIGNLSSLEVLDLGQNQLSSVPKEIGNLIHIIYLSIDDSNIRTLPETFDKLTKIESFYASNCGIATFPKGIKNWNRIKNLRLSKNNINEIPPSIGDMKYLENLDLRSNNLSELPKEISNLHYLRSISLGDNKEIQNLFEVLSKLKNLYSVNIPKQNDIGDINSRSYEAKLGWKVTKF